MVLSNRKTKGNWEETKLKPDHITILETKLSTPFESNLQSENDQTRCIEVPTQKMDHKPKFKTIFIGQQNKKQLKHIGPIEIKKSQFDRALKREIIIPFETLKLTKAQIEKLLLFRKLNLDVHDLPFFKIPKAKLREKEQAIISHKESFWTEAITSKSLFHQGKKRLKFRTGAKINGKTRKHKKIKKEYLPRRLTDESLRQHKKVILRLNRKKLPPFLKGRLGLSDSLHTLRENCGYLLDFMDSVNFLGRNMEHVFNGFVERASEKIVFVSRNLKYKKELVREVRMFNALYTRLKNACSDFLQIHAEEYRKLSKDVIILAEIFLNKLQALLNIQQKKILIDYRDAVQNLINYLEDEDNEILSVKGKIWDDKTKDVKWNYKTFQSKRKWIISLIMEIITEIQEKYYHELISSDGSSKKISEEEHRTLLKDYFERDEESEVGGKKENLDYPVFPV